MINKISDVSNKYMNTKNVIYTNIIWDLCKINTGLSDINVSMFSMIRIENWRNNDDCYIDECGFVM